MFFQWNKQSFNILISYQVFLSFVFFFSFNFRQLFTISYPIIIDANDNMSLTNNDYDLVPPFKES